MTIKLLSCDALRPDRRAIAQCLTEIAINVSPSLAQELTNIILDGDAITVEVLDKNSASSLRALRKWDIDYEICS